MKSDAENDEKTVDEILEVVGGFGKYQWILLLMLSYCMTCLGLQGLTMTFISSDPGWECVQNSTACNLTTVVTPIMDNYKKRCDMPSSQWKFPDDPTSIVTEASDVINTINGVFIFLSYFKLVCDRSIFKNIATSMVYLGWFLGAIIFGYISDRFGRKLCLLTSMTMMCLSGIVSAFSGVFWLFCLLKVFVGAGIGGAMTCIFILNTEFVGPKKRSFAAVFIWNFWIIGLCFVALFAYAIKDWKYLNLATSAPALLVVVLYYFIPESVRWLLVNGKYEQAENMLKKVAGINGFVYPLHARLKRVTLRCKGGNVLQLFSNRSLAIYTLVSAFLWLTCSMVYYGLSMSVGKLGGNVYLVFFLTSIVAVPGNLFSIFVLGKYGRKKPLIITITITAIAMIGAALITSQKQVYVIIRVTLAMIAKFLIEVSFNAAYLIIFELLPTTMRNVGMGITSAAARIGSFSASYIIYLSSIEPILPFVVFGVFAFLCAGASLIFPETNNTPTKESVSDEKNSSYLELLHQTKM